MSLSHAQSAWTKAHDPSMDESTNFFESIAGAAVLCYGLLRWSIEAFAAVLFNNPIPGFEEQYQFKNRDWIGL